MVAGVDILWRRLDRPGHDCARLWPEADLWQIGGMAVWRDAGGPACISYLVTCGPDWVTRAARVQGHIGARDISVSIHRDAVGNWRLNGEAVPEVAGFRDVDLGFTPVTNTLPIRRLSDVGQAQADIGAAWLDPADWWLKPLPQHYRWAERGQWHYASPEHDFKALLAVDRHGLITDYPGFWTQEM